MDHGQRRTKLAKEVIQRYSVALHTLTKIVFTFVLAALACASAAAQVSSGEPFRPAWCQQLPRPDYAKLERVKVISDWFEVYRIRPGVFAIYEPHQFEEVISYLILGNKGALLFDTGLGIGKISNLVAGLTSLPVTVLNSHTHFDHTGGNAEFSNILDEDTPFTHANEKGQSNIYSRDALAPDRICGALPDGVRASSYSIRPFHVVRRVKDGEIVSLGGRDLEVIYTAGHTPDSLCVLDRANGLLFTGDTFYPGPIYLFAPETNFAAYAKSVARLARITPQLTLLLPAHNVPVADPDFLNRLEAAVQKVQSSAAKPAVTEGRREYSFDGFSLLLAAD